MRVRLGFVCLVLLLVASAFADDAPQATPQLDDAPVVEKTPESSYALCPWYDCGGGGGGGGGTGCYDCSSNGTSASCYPNGRYWADCVGGSICWYLGGPGWYCEPYCGRRRCYNI